MACQSYCRHDAEVFKPEIAQALVSYGSNVIDLYRQAASYVDRILRGERSGDLLVQAPVKFELVINLKAARAIGLDVAYNVLILADRIIDEWHLAAEWQWSR